MKIRLLIVLIMLVVGAFLPMSPATTWSSGEQIAGAPPTQPGPDELVDARRAAGEAGSQAGFVTQGTSELKDGSAELSDGMGQLAEGSEAAASGATELSNGMNALSGGLSELGSGANQVADGVETAVNSVIGFEAVKGQVIAAIDDTLESTEGSRDSDVREARATLRDLRGQVETAELPEDIEGQLNQLRDGSREIANQLGTPGYDFYDGMYSATTGAMDLSAGLTELRDGTVTARDGAEELSDGAEQVDTMAGNTSDKIEAVQRAIPAPVMSTTEGGEEEVTSALAPLVALLISALMILGGAGIALAAFVAKRSKWSIVGFGTTFLTILGLILVMVLGVGLSPVSMLVMALSLALAAFGSSGLTYILLSAFGLRVGSAITAAVTAVQVGIVGWVWRVASVGPVSAIWESVSSALPLHWSTAALSAAGNGGSTQAMWIGIVLSAVLSLVGVVAFWQGKGQKAKESSEEARIDDTQVMAVS